MPLKSIRLCLFSVVFQISVPGNAFDRIATDEEAAKYRTGQIDPVVLKVPKQIQDGIVRQPEIFLKQLVDVLTINAANDFVKVKRIHDWITDNIAYDSDHFYGKGKKSDTLKDKRATCGGYATLFKDMVTLAGIEAMTIHGKSRVTYDSESNEMASHIWNATKINGKWYIVDTTHDDRFGFSNGKFGEKSKYRDTQLFISPQAKIIDNIPDNVQYQFLDNPIGMKQFLDFPIVNMYWFIKSEISFASDMNALIEKAKTPERGNRYLKISDNIRAGKNVVTVKLTVPDNVSVFSRVTDNNGKSFDANSICHREKDTATCLFSAPESGSYKAYISAKVNPQEKLYNKIYEFNLVGTGGAGPQLPPPYQLLQIENANYSGLKILEHNFADSDASEYFLKIGHPENIVVFSAIWDEKGVKLKSGTVVSLVNLPDGKMQSHFKYSVPRTGVHFIKVRIKNKGEKLFNTTAAIAKIGRR